ncbi:hypothetical protein M5G27_26805 [Pseudomonas shahriarae]|jgi:hypothetical protein|uniref:Uncharacterized protein n=2 Tax=Pseudomonas TaxID=286 RepID=A0A9X4HCI9_9PSED|nr:hypothetical protein [Pseudomonas shahriarae]MDD1011086.1 hypothetical protein [Pseudomonas shahriarae]
MSKHPQLAFKMVTGTEAATALAARLVEESAFFQVTPLPDDEYEFAVKIDRESLLVDPVDSPVGEFEDADFTIMDLKELAAWYLRNVGYDPVEDDPSTQLEVLRALCTEMLAIDRAGGLDSN